MTGVPLRQVVISAEREPGAGYYCDEGHRLKEVRWGDLKRSRAYSERWFCDLCRKENGLNFVLDDADMLLHCAECSYDVCPGCLKRRKHLLARGARTREKKIGLTLKRPADPHLRSLKCVCHAAYSFPMAEASLGAGADPGTSSSAEFSCKCCRWRSGKADALAPTPPGGTILVCTSPTCANAYCGACAEALADRARDSPLIYERRKAGDTLLRTRYCSGQHQMLPAVFANLQARPGARKGFACEYCERLYDKPDPDTLLFQCEDCQCFMCCACFFRTSVGRRMTEAQSNRAIGASMKKLASRLDSLLARRQEKSKPLMPLPPELPVAEVFPFIELRVHRMQKAPEAIVYEVERQSLRQAEASLAPFLRELLCHAVWPLHTSLRLITLCRDGQRAHSEASELWACQIAHLSRISFEMLNDLDLRDVEALFRSSSPSKRRFHVKPLLALALEADHKQFLAHKSVNRVFRSQWETSVLPIQEESTKGMLFTSYITWTVAAWLLYLVNWFSRGHLARYSLSNFENHRWLAAILGPLNREKVPMASMPSAAAASSQPRVTGTLHKVALYGNRPRFWLERWALSYKRKWRLTFSVRFRFSVHLIAYLAFLGLVSFMAFSETSPRLEKVDFALAAFILGFALNEVEKIKHRGIDEHYSDFFNRMDAVHVVLWAALIAAKVLAAFLHHQPTVRMLINFYDALFSCVIIVSYVRTLYALLALRGIGPLLIVIGRMIGDVLRFVTLASVFLAGFAFSLFKLFRGALFASISSSSIQVQNATAASASTDNRDSFLRTLANLYFAIVGGTDLNLGSGYKEIIGNVLVGAFMITTTIVLINLLIAMMSSSFQKVEAQADAEWKARFARLVTEFGSTSVVPAPLNIFSWLIWLIVNPFARCVLGCQILCCLDSKKALASADEGEDDGDRRGSTYVLGGGGRGRRSVGKSKEPELDSSLLEDSRDEDFGEGGSDEDEPEEEFEEGHTVEIIDELKGLDEEAAEHEAEEDEKEEAREQHERRKHSDPSFGRYVQGLSRELFQEGLEAEASVRQKVSVMLGPSPPVARKASKGLPRQSNRMSVSVRRQTRHLPGLTTVEKLAGPAPAPTAEPGGQKSVLLAETKEMLREAVSQLLVEWTLSKPDPAGPGTSASVQAHSVVHPKKK